MIVSKLFYEFYFSRMNLKFSVQINSLGPFINLKRRTEPRQITRRPPAAVTFG